MMDQKFNEDYAKLLYKIIKSLPVYLAYKNKENIYQVVSNKVDLLYKGAFDSIEGLSVDDVYSNEAKANVLSQDKQVYDEKKPHSQMIDVETVDGLRTLKSTRIPIFNHQKDIEGILTFSQDIEEFIKLDQELKSLSKMQVKLIELIKLFHKIDVDNYSDIVNQSLELLGRTIEADRAYVFSYHFDENTMDNIYEWCEEGIKPEIDDLKGIPIIDFLDGWVNNHRRKESVIISDITNLEPTSNLYQILEPQGIQSLVTMPIFINDLCYGFIGFDAVKEKKNWESIPEIFKIVPELYASLFYQHDILVTFDQLKKDKQIAEAAQSQFLAKVTHEIKTPIGGITASLDLLKETKLDEDQREYAEIMTYSIDILKSMVQNILQHSKISANKMIRKSTEINLETEIIKLIKTHKYMATAKNIGLYMNYDYKLPLQITTDVEKLRQILNNLISNAVKYTNYGSVEVKVSLVEKNAPYINVLFEIIDTGIGIEESDKKQITREFYQVADKLNKNPSGTGLGLSIASDLIQFLKGSLKVSSQKNVGSNFSFQLMMYAPAYEERQKIDAHVLLVDMTSGKHSNIIDLLKSQFSFVHMCRAKAFSDKYDHHYDLIFVHTNHSSYYLEMIDDVLPLINHYHQSTKKVLLVDDMKDQVFIDALNIFDDVREVPINSETVIGQFSESTDDICFIDKKTEYEHNPNKLSILIVDDNNINRIVMKKTIQSMNINVTEAENGYEAINLVKQINFDLILMDILMPGMNGYVTTEKIRGLGGLHSNIPIVAVSANELESTKEKALSYGISAVLEKPLNKKDLEHLLIDFFGEDYQNKKKNDQPKSEIFNVKAFEDFFNENNLRIDIIQTFIQEKSADIDRLEKAFQSNSSTKIYNAVHYLKGSFSYLKAQRLFDLSNEILELCNNKRIDDVRNQYNQYLLEYENFHRVIKTYLKTLK